MPTNKTTKEFLNSQKSITSGWLQVSIGLGLLSGFLLIAQAWFLANTMNAVVFERQTLADVQAWLWGLIVVFIIRAVLAWASEQAAFHATAKIKQQLRNRLHRHLQEIGPIGRGNERSGERVNTLVDGIEALENYYARYLPAMSLVVLIPLSILVFVFPFDWISGLIMLGTAPLIPFFMILIGKGTESLNKKQWRKLARMSAHFLDMIQGLTTLKIFNTSKHEAEVIARISDEYRHSTMSVLRVAFLSSLALEFLATISIAMVAVLIGFRLYYGEMDFLLGFFMLLLAPEFYLPLRNMGTHYHARMEAVGAAEQMIEILETPVTEPHTTKLESKDKQSVSQNLGGKLAIQFNQVSFEYEEGRQALADFTMEVPAGKTLALVGASGAGKSTVVKLLLGFIKSTQGNIEVNGIKLDEIPLDQWREQIAWVPQSPYLFHGTIAENIALGDEQASKEQIIIVAQQANISDYIESLPNAYDTRIGEKGVGLSGGQIQRIALARAFLKDAPLLILDEPTANLDKESEQLILQSIKVLSKDKTIITIAHRLNTIKNADQIVVIEAGKVLESGSHQQLIKQSTHYREMLASFSGSDEFEQGGGL